MAEITVAADLDSLNDVLAFVDGEMERAGCSMKLMTQVDMAGGGSFVKIPPHAYPPGAGEGNGSRGGGGGPPSSVSPPPRPGAHRRTAPPGLPQ